MSDQRLFTRLPAIARRLLPGALLILPGCTFIGVAVGQMVGDPSTGLRWEWASASPFGGCR